MDDFVPPKPEPSIGKIIDDFKRRIAADLGLPLALLPELAILDELRTCVALVRQGTKALVKYQPRRHYGDSPLLKIARELRSLRIVEGLFFEWSLW